jgi:hypothetical protein
MLSKQERERYVREQTGTFMSHTHDDLGGGRFAAISNPHIVGSTAVPRYPQASEPFQHDPVGLEPGLGYRINDVSADADAAEAGGAPAAPALSSPLSVERGAPSTFSDPAMVISQPSRHVHPEREAGSSDLRRRKM